MADSLATFELRQDARPGGLCDPDDDTRGADLVDDLIRTPHGRALLGYALDHLCGSADQELWNLWDACVAEANRVRA